MRSGHENKVEARMHDRSVRLEQPVYEDSNET